MTTCWIGRPPVSISFIPPGGMRMTELSCRAAPFAARRPGKFENIPASRNSRHAAVMPLLMLPRRCERPMP